MPTVDQLVHRLSVETDAARERVHSLQAEATQDFHDRQRRFTLFVALADRKKNIYDQDLIGLLPEGIRERRHEPVSELDEVG